MSKGGHSEGHVGGLGKEQHATAEIQKICDEVKHEAEKKAGHKFKKFVAKSYSTQVVAGTNYFIKVDVGDHEFVHLRVFQGLACNGSKVELSAIQTKKTLDNPITYF
ncbi:cystatin-B-like [Brachyhypopomus gauderio]|uniref:cystatin-B-like n=1 Tax=Brachyhypopomus gauderio TaxID=698409 RepID=UPI004041A327